MKWTWHLLDTPLVYEWVNKYWKRPFKLKRPRRDL